MNFMDELRSELSESEQKMIETALYRCFYVTQKPNEEAALSGHYLLDLRAAS